jgi:hypothetical protein
MLVACTGDVRPPGGSDDPGVAAGRSGAGGVTRSSGSSGGAGSSGGVVQLSPARVRRLTATEIRNSLRDRLLGGNPPSADFPDEELNHKFDNQFDTLGVSTDLASALQAAAEEAGAAVAARLTQDLPCAKAPTDERACAGTFLDSQGRRLFRRPLSAVERDRYLGLFDAVRKQNDFATSIATLVEALVQSPAFLFRTELGDGKGEPVRLDPYEIASALSYGLSQSAPDDGLLDAAAGGRLANADGVASEAKRLLGSSAAAEGLGDFLMQWLELKHPEALAKMDPASTSALSDAAIAETTALARIAIGTRDGSWHTLLTSTSTLASGPIAKLYGMPAPSIGAAPLTLDAKTRAGFFTQPAFIAAHTPAVGFSPIFLGLFVRTKMLCATLPLPPDQIPPVSTDKNLTDRQRFAAHSGNPGCNSCHTLMDPIGWAFERYDSLGRYRESTSTGPLTGDAEISGGTDVDGKLTGAVELAKRLEQSHDAQACFAGQLFGWLVGRDVANQTVRTSADDAALARALRSAPQANVSDLAVSLVTSDAFLLRQPAKVEN